MSNLDPLFADICRAFFSAPRGVDRHDCRDYLDYEPVDESRPDGDFVLDSWVCGKCGIRLSEGDLKRMNAADEAASSGEEAA